NGELLLEDGGIIKVMDLLGDVTLRLEPDAMDILYHHDVTPSRDGGFWTLGNRVVDVNRFPTDYDDLSHRENVPITDDILIELDPAHGVLRRIFLLDVLDPLRLGYDSLNPHPELGTPRDWAHANAIVE